MKKIINPRDGIEGYFCFGCAKVNEAGLKMDFYEDGEECSKATCTYFTFSKEKALKETYFNGCETEEDTNPLI